MRPLLYSLVLSVLAVPAFAQNACVTPPPVEDPCMVGHWVGENTVAERIRDMLQSTAPASVMRDIEARMSPVLGMSIYEDGFYHTLPIHHDSVFTDTHRETGDVTNVRMDIAIPTQVGFINGQGGEITFCDAGSPPAMFGATVNGSSSGGALSGGGPVYVPKITYSCVGNSMNMTVFLPAPINQVDYFLRKVPAAEFDENIERLHDAARALAGE